MIRSTNKMMELLTYRMGVPGGVDRLEICSETYIEWRQGSGNSVEILDITVANEHRREGFGRGMVRCVIERFLKPEVKTVYAITRASNRAAQQFYERLRFRPHPLRHFYKDEPLVSGEEYTDAILYVFDIGSQA